ncbi:ankyrin repeat domain-containing protein 11-like [Saccostrea cucullata]|uniref:ankyrin repeat domain-containing protein 11-like n=1 Tax=Saccostrea cuccullata TaxID=36930 RepID=UPI002ED04A72
MAKQTSSNEVTCISRAETQKVNTAEKSKTEKTISTEQQSSDLDKTKLLEDANVDTTKHTTKVTSPKQAREKPGDAFGGKTMKVDLKKAREKLQNNKTEDKTLKMETDKEKTQRAEQNLMVIDKSSLLSDGTKKQQTSPKSLPKHDRFEQIEEPTKITSSSYSPKSRTKISKNDSSDETEQINFKDTIDNIKTNLKSRPKQNDSKERLMPVKKEISNKSTKTENKTEEVEMYKIDSSQQKDDKRILSSTKNTSEENTQEKTLLKGKDTKITVDESDTSKKDDKTTQIPHFDKDRSKSLPGDRDSINTADLQTKKEESSKKKDKSNSSGKNSKENKGDDSSDRKMLSLEITDKEPGHNEEKPNWKKLIKVDKMKSKEEKSNPTLKDIISQTRNKLQKPPKVTDLLQPEPGQDVQDGQVEIGEDKVIGKQTNTEAPSPLNAQNTEILNKSTQSILANHKQGINDDIKVLKQDNESSNEDSGKMKTLKQTEKDISFNLKTEELKTNEVKLKMGEHQKIKMLENNSSRKLANRALEEENSRSLKSASDNMTKILDKQTLEVSTKQPEEKSKNRHHKSKTTDGKTIVLDPGNTKSNSTTDVKLGSRADDKVHITHNTEVGAKESKLVNQEKESNEMCQGTLALYTHRKKQSQAKNEAEVKGVTEPQSNLDRKNETSRGKTNLKTTSVAEKHTEGKKSSRAELHTGDKSGSSFDQHSVNNEGIKDEKNICAYTQQEKSFVNKQSNKTIGVTKGLEETAIIKPDVSDESPRNKDNKRASTSKGSNKKTKVLKEFVVINEVKPVSDGDILQTGGAANKMKDLSERGEEATVINLKPVSKKVTLQESDIKNEGESEQVKDLLRSREKSIDVDKKSGKDALSGIENGSSAPPEEPQPKKKELAETEDKKSLSKTDNKNGVSKKDELQTKTKSRHKFELPLLKSSKVKADSVAPEKTSKQNSITIEEKPGKGFLNTEGNSNLKETLDQKAEMSVNLKSTKADKQVSDGVSKSKSALKVKFDTEVKYSSGNEVNENLNRKHSKDSKAGTSKSSQDDKDVKHSGGSPIQNRKKVAQDNGQGGPKQNGKKQEVCSDPGVLLSPKGSPKENRKKLTAGSDQNGSPKQNRKKLNTASDPENNGLQKKVHFKDVDKDYQRKVYAQEVAKKIQTSIIADMRSKLRSKAAAIEKHQERIKAKEAKTQEKSSQPVMSTAQAEVKETSQLASKPAIKLSPETPTESPDNRKTQGVSTSTASEKSKQELITAVKTIEKTDIVKENQTKDKGKAEQKEDLVTENKETKSVKQNEKVTEKYKNDSKKNEEKSEGKQNVSSSPILVTKNRDMSEDISRGEQANQGVFDVSKFITNTKIKEFKKELKTDDQHQEKEKKLSGKDIQITRGVESNQRNDIQFISTSFSGPESPTSVGSSKDDQKSPEFTYQKFDFDESSESKSHSSDSTVRADQVSDEEEVGEGSNEDIMAELRKLLPLEIFSSRRRHRTEDDEDVPCDCCECQGSSEDEYSMDGRMPQLSVIGEEDEETVSVFDPDKMDSEEMQFHRTFMEKVYSRNPRASKVFNPGVIVSSSDSEESEEAEESDDSAFDSMKRPVFDIEAFLKYTGNVEDWLERIEEFGNVTGMLPFIFIV